MRTNHDVEPLVYPGNMFQTTQNMGLTKRELFSVLLLAGMLANPDNREISHQVLTIEAIGHADLLIEALAKGDQEAE